ncbi:MAG: NF038122 family metalloprotease [Planctomycetota bacterium]|nr:NF038122 family metalloprotease [Planctomycetota bacterium]
MKIGKKRAARDRRLIRHSSLLAFATLGVGSVARGGFVIHPVYDSNVTTLPNAAAIETAFAAAAQQFDNLFTNDVTINIHVSASSSGSFLGTGGGGNINSLSYSTLRSDLVSHAASPVDTAAIASLPLSDPVAGNHNYWLETAEGKVLGTIPAQASPSDGTFTFSTNPAFTFNFNPNNRAIAGQYDFVGVAEHEIAHILGRSYLLGTPVLGTPAYYPMDLFRYSAPGTPNITPSGTSYFSIDSGTTNLMPFSTSSDLVDWGSTTPYSADSSNAFSSSGVENDLTPVDIALLDTLGFNVVTTPRTLTWDASTNTIESTHWLNSTSTLTPTYIGASLVVGTGGQVTYSPTNLDAKNISFSSSSIDGQSLTINQGTFFLNNANGIASNAYYLIIDDGGALAVNGATTYDVNGNAVSSPSHLNVDGGLIIGNLPGSTASATFTGGINKIGLNSPADPAIYVGNGGTGTLTQSGTAFVSTTGSVNIAALAGSTGTYQLQGGSLAVAGSVYVGGAGAGGPIADGGTGNFNQSGGTLAANSVIISSTGTWNQSGGAAGVNSFQLNSGATFGMSAGSLTISNALTVSSGVAFIQSGGSLTAPHTANDATISQTGGVANLGILTGAGSLAIGSPAGNTAAMTVATLAQTSVLVDSTGLLTVTGGGANNALNTLQINNGGLLNITSSGVTLNYTAASPNATVRGYISSGYNPGSAPWTGTTGITSSNAAADSAHHSVAFADGADGVVINLPANISSAVPGGGALPAGAELITYAFAGDANLDGKVDFSDFVILSNHFGGTFTNWDQGNFNYDSGVDFSDFVILSNNFGEGVTGNGTGATPVQLAQYNAIAASFGISTSQIAAWDHQIGALPEPGAIGLLAIGSIGLMSCGRRKSKIPKK